jgi:RNA polymerase sigma-70 factor (ECF subfamily)
MTSAALQDRFQTLVEKHKKILYKVCYSYCKNPGDRDDLAQEIIIQLWRSLEVAPRHFRRRAAARSGG